MLFIFLLVVHAIIAAALVAVILMQRSEDSGLGMGGGGSPSGLMNARGAADFLTRATSVLATIFVLMSIGLAVLAASRSGERTIDTSLARPAGTASQPATPAPEPPAVPLAQDQGQAPASTPADQAPAAPAAPAPQK
jgi:preprotein translocase subunit SecG